VRQRRVPERHSPVLEYADAVAKRKRFIHVVCHEDHGLPQVSADALELGPQFLPRDAVERAEGFIHKEDGRIDGERARNADSLPLTA
jgi:hypothetical protein